MRTIFPSLAMALAACSSNENQADSISDSSNVVTSTLPSEPAASSMAGNASNEAVRPGVSVIARTSRFSKLDAQSCKLVSESEEGGGWTRDCVAPDGHRLRHIEGDLRQDLAIDGQGLAINRIVANSAFSNLGQTIEWRGPDGKRADAMIIRVNVARPEGTGPDVSKLAIIGLDPKPCVVAVVEPGPGQNDKAKAIADGPRRACR